jgi:hypothetical protein
MLQHTMIPTTPATSGITIASDDVSPQQLVNEQSIQWDLSPLNSDLKTQTVYYEEAISLPSESSPTEESSEPVSWRLSAWSDDEENVSITNFTLIL